MHRVSVEGSLGVSAEAAWAVLADFGKVQCYHPKVKTSRLTSDGGIGLGTQRMCSLVDGQSVTETIVAYEEGRGYTTEVRGLNKPLSRVFGQVALEPTAASSCRLRIGVAFAPRFGPLGWLLAVLLLRPMMKRQLRRTFAGLDHYLRTGSKLGAAATSELPAEPQVASAKSS